jgi:hypothetical protein
MKRKILVLLMLLGFGYIYWGTTSRQHFASAVVREETTLIHAAPLAAAKNIAQEKLAEASLAAAAESEALPPMAPARLFPGAKVISFVESAADAQGKVHVIKTLETKMKQKFVQVVETYIDGEASEANLVEQHAMVANQILAQKPEAMTEDRFLRVLGETGASDIKKVGESFLVTFQAEPQNPHALDGFLARVRGSADGLVVEPNYIRRLF